MNGFQVDRGVAGLETAFIATLPGHQPGPVVAFLAEYDALPALGHACGHNLIAAAALGAGLAMKAAMPELSGTIKVVGTPAEEGGGGKAIMADAGVFQDLDAAIMVHPSGRNMTRHTSLSCYSLAIEFTGQAAHAASAPEKGINALDAMILTFVGIGAMRQHLRDDARIHGIITHGGEAPNIVPEYTSASFLVRAADTPYATEVVAKLRACAEGAAQATGATLAFGESAARLDAMMPNPELAAMAEENLLELGIEVTPPSPDIPRGSSDMGNVSQLVPSLHPYLAIGQATMGHHTVEFREAAAAPEGHRAMIQAAMLMAMTAVDLLAEPENVVKVRNAFLDQRAALGLGHADATA
jgi:amidohydrolase